MASRAPKKKTRKTAFVPSGLFVGVMVTGVVPMVACGGSVQGGGAVGVAGDAFAGVAIKAFDDGGTDGESFRGGVAACCFDAIATVAMRAFDAGEDVFAEGVAVIGFADGGPPPRDATLGVAADAFAGVADVAFRDAEVTHDAPLGVALCCFEGGK